MFKHTAIRCALGALLLVSLVAALVLRMPQHARATPAVVNVQVNQPVAGPFPTNKQVEPTLAQNPTNPLNLVAGSIDYLSEPACSNTTPSSCPSALGVPGISISGFYASFDGGLTWPCQGVIDLSAFGEYAWGDPSLAFDSRGNAYYGTLARPFPPTTDESATGLQPDFFVAKSTDGGCHYPSAAKVSGDSPAQSDDKDALAVDANPSSPFHDTIYAAWTIFTGRSATGAVMDQISFARSKDGGQTFSAPRPISPANSTATTFRQGAAVRVAPDGTVYVAWLAAEQNRVVQFVVASHDGGATFGQPVVAALVTDDFITANDFVSPLPGASFTHYVRTFPSLAVGGNGTLYLVWSNSTSGHAVILLTRSTDGGLTWSTPAVAGDVSGRSAFFASVVVDPRGRVGLVFNALDDKPAGTAPGVGVVFYDTYVTQSSDGGASWSLPLRISTAPSDPDGSSLNNLRAERLGDYITAVADARGGGLFAVWTDTRNASPCAAVDAFRAGTGPKPDVITQCPPTFGNTDIYAGIISW